MRRSSKGVHSSDKKDWKRSSTPEDFEKVFWALKASRRFSWPSKLRECVLCLEYLERRLFLKNPLERSAWRRRSCEFLFRIGTAYFVGLARVEGLHCTQGLKRAYFAKKTTRKSTCVYNARRRSTSHRRRPTSHRRSTFH